MTQGQHEGDSGPLTDGTFDEEVGTDSSQETVGVSDAEADAARAGADVDMSGLGGGDAQRDTAGVPVGEADADEDARRAGA